MSLISFIIPFYNQAKYIEETLLSALASTYRNFEIIIVDDGSEDKNKTQLLEIIEKINDKRIRVFHQQNAGPSVARNFAISKANGEYLVFLDGDDLIEKETLEIGLRVFSETQDIDVVYGNNILFGEKNKVIMPNEIHPKNILVFNPIAVCVMIKKSVFQNNQFDEYLSKLGLEDWELWMNLISKNYKFYYINHNLFKIRVLPNSRTTTEANPNLAKIKAYSYQKHSDFLAKQYNDLYYTQKQTLETPDYKIGNILMKPYRWFKKVFR
jgi:glycosyltransferase involved in cell wall biosynthesis